MRLSVIALACFALPALGAQEPATFASSPLSEPELVQRLGATLDSLAKLDEFSGVVLLARQGTPVFQQAYGFANRESQRPNDLETAFNIGSINKLFTAMAIRQLSAEGKLHLDSSLATYWPDYANSDVARRVTIRQILQHRSGIGGDIFSAPPGKTRHDLRHNKDFLQLFSSRPLDFEPGSQQRYSNAGYIVLGALVERLSGRDYYEYVRERIYTPAGMTRTGAWPPDSLPPNTARGYTRRNGSVEPNTPLLPGRGSAAGGGYSTAQDLSRLLQAIRAGKIPGAPPAGIGIAGGAPGLNAAVDGGLPGGYDLIVLANLDPPAAMRVARTVRGWLRARD